MAALVTYLWQGLPRHEIEHIGDPRPRAARPDEKRIPLTEPQSHMPIDVVVAFFRLRGDL